MALLIEEPKLGLVHEKREGCVLSHSGALLCSLGLGDHLVQRHGAVAEVANGLHVANGHTIRFPLRDRGLGHADVRGKRLGAASLSLQPVVQVHGASLARTKPKGQAIPKPPKFRVGLSMDADRRRRFKEWFASVYGEKEDARALHGRLGWARRSPAHQGSRHATI